MSEFMVFVNKSIDLGSFSMCLDQVALLNHGGWMRERCLVRYTILYFSE